MQVHDDTSLLCLPNTERIRLDPSSVRIVLEAPDMRGASPGLLSRMRCVTLSSLKRRWMCAALLHVIQVPACVWAAMHIRGFHSSMCGIMMISLG